MSRGQNTSSAVMQQRKEAHDSLDDFPTPPWATRAMCEKLIELGVDLESCSVREPCANRGYMVAPLREYFGDVIASDIFDYGFGFEVQDYLFGLDGDIRLTDWTFFNPPFRLSLQFILRALRRSRVGVVAIVRTSFLEGVGRYRDIYRDMPPWGVFHSVERIPMVKGRYDPKASTATSYTWLVWRKDTADRLPPQWIAPCRKRLERTDDVLIGAPQ